MVWYGLVWFGMVWYGLLWFGTVWFGIVLFGKRGGWYVWNVLECSGRLQKVLCWVGGTFAINRVYSVEFGKS